MKSFSLVLPTLKAHQELELCLNSIERNSKLENELIVIVDVEQNGHVNKNVINLLRGKKINYYLNNTNLGPYRSWNKGAKIAKKEILCFITDDQYFAKGWDIGIMKFMKENLIISGQLVEPGVLLPSFPTIVKDFGDGANNFKEKEFLNFAKNIKEDRLVDGIFFIPLAIFKKKFFELNNFPTRGKFGTKSIPNDQQFVKKSIQRGLQFRTSLAGISYHFQAASWGKNRRIKKHINKLKLILLKDKLLKIQKV